MYSPFPSVIGLTPAQQAAGVAAAQNRGKQYFLSWIYDSNQIATTATTSADFFTVPQGQSSKTWTDTNMRSSGILPGVRALTVATVLLSHFNATAGTVLAADLGLLAWGYFALFIQDRPQPDYIQTKLLCGGPGVVVGGSTTRGCFGNGTIANALSFHDPFLVTIQPNEPFRGEMRWDSSISITEATEVTVALYGRGTREV